MKKYLFLPVLQLLSVGSHGQEMPDMKNVVVIIDDDHALKVTGAYGNDIINTPHIDRLSREGITFNRAYCNAPICSASRQSILTGKYPHATGVNLLFTPFPDEGNVTIAEHLKKSDYQTAMIGKTHWNNWVWSSLYQDGMPTHGFDEVIQSEEYRQFLKHNPPAKLPDDMDFYNKKSLHPEKDVAEWMNCRVLPQPIDDEHSMGTYYTNQAINFIKQHKDNPFFVWLAFKEPHHPYYFPVEYTGKYKPEDMPLPEGSPEDDRWIPARFKNLTDDEKRGIIASYYTSTEYMDKNTGLVLDALEKLGLEENTLVVYLSDNGYLLNEHKRFEKHTMWEEATHQPMIFRLGTDYRSGEQPDAIVEYIDVVPTILDLIGRGKINEVQGKSFMHVIQGKTDEFREYAFSEYLQDNLAMVCTKKWKYMFTTGSRDLTIGYQTGLGPSGIVHRLYDLENDPTESTDVSELPENKEILLKMQQLMLRKFMDTHPDAADCPQQITLEGKLVWFCEPRDIGYEQNLIEKPARVFKKE